MRAVNSSIDRVKKDTESNKIAALEKAKFDAIHTGPKADRRVSYVLDLVKSQKS